jgi:hypothetical protein
MGFDRAVKTLRWTNPTITRVVKQYATRLMTEARLAVPDLCRDLREWALNSFKVLPVGAMQFNRQSNEVSEGTKEVPRQLLAPYIHAGERATVQRTRKIMAEVEAAELKIGLRAWSEILDVVGLNT